jgi:DNA replication and repair protein RecF
VRARLERAGLERAYEVELTAAAPGGPVRKTARVDGKPVRAVGDYFGGFNVVLFVPDDLLLPRGAPAVRRRFLDRALWNAEPAFLVEAQAYDRLLRSRNALLREPAPRPDLLAVYDEQLAAAGSAVVARRRRFVAALAPLVADAWERITRSGRPISLSYESRLGALPDEALAAALLDGLRATRPRDLQLRHTSFGPHGDDLALQLDGRSARLHASQGQVRALVLSLKVAEIRHLAATLDSAPILLLDDVSSELDPARTRFLFDFLGAIASQVFLTTTTPAVLPIGASERLDFRISEGGIARS